MNLSSLEMTWETVNERGCGHSDNMTLETSLLMVHMQNPKWISVTGFDSVCRKVRLLIQTEKTFFFCKAQAEK